MVCLRAGERIVVRKGTASEAMLERSAGEEDSTDVHIARTRERLVGEYATLRSTRASRLNPTDEDAASFSASWSTRERMSCSDLGLPSVVGQIKACKAC